MTDPRTDIRDKVAEAIWDAWESDMEEPTEFADAGPVLTHLMLEMADAAIAAHVEALNADGYAVIKLPKPCQQPPPRWRWRKGVTTWPVAGDFVGLWREGILLPTGDMIAIQDARNLAAALLAAAERAEANPADELVRETEALGLYPKAEASE